jgi:colicin import membrane protein
MGQASTSADGWFHHDWRTAFTRRLGRAVGVSLALHVGVLIVVAFVRLPQQGERPLASIEISLANLPTPPAKAVDPPKVIEAPKVAPVKVAPLSAPMPTPVKPAPVPAAMAAPVKVAPVPAPLPAPAPKAAPVPAPPIPAKLSNDVMRDVMKGVELPPDAPKFGDFSPAEKPKKSQLKLPDVPVVSEVREPATTQPDLKSRTSLTDDLSKELDEEFKKIKNLELPKPVPLKTEATTISKPQVEAKAPSVKAIETTLKVPGMAPGSNAYLARVRQRISSYWSAPPVDVTEQAHVVIVKFRLHRNGTVSGVSIEQSSGNEYYDLAGKRAVVSAIPLPAFPSELTESYFDAHFTFTVGEQG